MKLNWGHKLVFFTVLFMLFIIGMVYYISGQQVELVAADYYEKGINYQQEKDKYSLREGKDYSFSYEAARQTIVLKVIEGKMQEVALDFYRPSDAKLDFSTVAYTNAEGELVYSSSGLAKGRWNLNCEWEQGTKKVAMQKEIFIQ